MFRFPEEEEEKKRSRVATLLDGTWTLRNLMQDSIFKRVQVSSRQT